MQPPAFRFEHVSGPVRIGPDTNEIVGGVVNRGESEEVVRALVFVGGGATEILVFDSLNASPLQGLGDGTVRPGDSWGPFTAQTDSSGSYWAVFRTTSKNLVPSLEFRHFEGEPRHVTTYLYVQPGDFAVFSLPIAPGGPGVEPGDVGPVTDE
jgi:hypothetical protein